MGSRPKGYALVISNEIFKNDVHSTRYGGQLDRENLKKLFTDLGYEVTIMKNLSKQEMEIAILQFRNRPDHKNVDSTIVFILSHGEEKSSNDIKLITSDNQNIYSQWIIEQFYGENCSALLGKPKLFFFQCCRGKEKEKFVEFCTMGSGEEDSGPISAPNKSDIFIAYACAPGNIALRSSIFGSWFVHCMCQIFADEAHNTELNRLMQDVSNTIGWGWFDYKLGTEVVCFTGQGFNKLFYFNPGLYD